MELSVIKQPENSGPEELQKKIACGDDGGWCCTG